MFLLDLFDAVYACCMASAGEFFLEESVDHAECYAQTYNALTECQDLCIVMLSAHLSHELVGAQSASDSLVLIAYERDSDTGTADGDASFRPAA